MYTRDQVKVIVQISYLGFLHSFSEDKGHICLTSEAFYLSKSLNRGLLLHSEKYIDSPCC